MRSPPPLSWLRDLSGAWIFYSVLPAWPGIEPRFTRIARFAPWIGAVLGGLQGALWAALEGRVPALAQVGLTLALAVWLSGGLHMDGDHNLDGFAKITQKRDSSIFSCNIVFFIIIIFTNVFKIC